MTNNHDIARGRSLVSQAMKAGQVQTVSRETRAGAEYVELKRLVQSLGLLKRQPRFYACKFALTLGLLTLAWTAIVFSANDPWMRLVEAAVLAFAFGQIGLLGHDVAHQQIVGSGRLNVALGLFLGNFLFGVSRGWWRDNHGAHHAHPNDLESDPNVNILFLACTPSQASRRPRWVRWVLRHQVALMGPIFCLEYFSMHHQSAEFVVRGKPGTARGEGILLIAHFVLYGLILYSALGLAGALAFAFIHQALTGFYLASIFAPNHKGMPLVGQQPESIGFLRQQATTARNVRGGLLVDLVYGGLNYQVEHHLFPSMARNNLKLAQPVVAAYCAARGIAYCETGVVESWRQIFEHFGNVSRALKQPVVQARLV